MIHPEGPRLQAFMTAEDITQVELAAMLGVQQSAVSKYVLGKVPIPLRHIAKMRAAYGVSYDYLLDGVLPMKKLRIKKTALAQQLLTTN